MIPTFIVAILSLFLLSCAQTKPVSPATFASPTLEARLVSSRFDCLQKLPFSDDRLTRENRAILDALARQGVAVHPPLVDPNADKLLAEARAPARGPVLWLYSGHGDLLRHGTKEVLSDREKALPTVLADSALCLSDGPLTIESVVRALPPSAPYVLMIVNACFSADVDVRDAPTDMSLLSLSVWQGGLPDKGTYLGQAMRDTVFGTLDRDGDGWLSDIELFIHLRDDIDRREHRTTILKLRRQIHATPQLLTIPKGTVQGVAYEVPARLQVESYRHFDIWRARAVGYVPAEAPMTIAEAAVSARRLVATSCRTDVGQCFQSLPTAPSPP